MWKDLTLEQKAEIMKMSVANGVTDINDIKAIYDNEAHKYQLGGYKQWKNAIAKYKHLDIDNDPTYDYEGFYNSDPVRAWGLLDEEPSAHFVDNFKTAQHPTFSKESDYSGKVHPIYNPQGVEGGIWGNKSFTLSKDWQKGPSLQDRISYLEDAEDEGVTLYGPNGELPIIYSNDIWGGVLPNVDVYSKALGGHLFAKGGSKNKNQTPKYRYGLIEQALVEGGAGGKFRVTSGRRKPNEAGNKGKSSAHTYTLENGDPAAIDIVPVGITGQELLDIMASPLMQATLSKYGFDILNESSKEMMAKNAATGQHLHVGKGIKGQQGKGQIFGGGTWGTLGRTTGGAYTSSGNHTYTSIPSSSTQTSEPFGVKAPKDEVNPWVKFLAEAQQSTRPASPAQEEESTPALTAQSNLTDFSSLNTDPRVEEAIQQANSQPTLAYMPDITSDPLWNDSYDLFEPNTLANEMGGY